MRIPPERCLIVGEVAQAHDGSLALAHAYIDAIAAAGADAVKFQTHIAAAESTAAEPWRVPIGGHDRSRYDYWKRMEFSEAQWRALATHAVERGLHFLSSPFSIEAVELLAHVGVAAWKIPSGEVGNALLLARVAASGLPVLLSTGMSPLVEIDAAVEKICAAGLPLVVLQCTSMYPTPPERVGLNMLPFFRQRYQTPVGLSDHSGTIYPGIAAAAMGIAVLEVHVTLSREMPGPDVAASVTTDELRQLVAGVRCVERMVAAPLDKDAQAEALAGTRRLFTKSVVARAPLDAGTVLRPEHLAMKKPGGGLPASRWTEAIGRRLRRAVEADEAVREEDLEDAG